MQADVLHFFRTANHLSQKTVADLLKVSQPFYSKLEDGSEKLSPQAAEKLATSHI